MKKQLIRKPSASDIQQWLPTYQIRYSTRARSMQLQFRRTIGLEVVVPQRFKHCAQHAEIIIELLQSHKTWILKQYQQKRVELRPKQIMFTAIGEEWQIVYHETLASTYNNVYVMLQEDSCQKTLHITIEGDALKHAEKIYQNIVKLLREWAYAKAKMFLVPLLQQLSHETGLVYEQVAVRGQRTCWGSCSAQKNISLNYKLIFLPKACVRYVLLHELCHLRFLNHSKAFWQLLMHWDPEAKNHRHGCRLAQSQLPDWVE